MCEAELIDQGLHCTTDGGCLKQSSRTKVYTVPHKAGVLGRVARLQFTLYHRRWVCEAELLYQGLHCTTEGGCLEQSSKTKVYTVLHKVGVSGRVAKLQFTLYHRRWVCEAELQDQGLHFTTQDGCLWQSYKTNVYTVPHNVGVLGRVKIQQFTLYHTRWVS